MADKEYPGLWATSPNEPAIITHPNIITPRPFKGKGGNDTGEPKYDLNVELPAESTVLTAAKQIAIAVAKAKWPGREIVPWNNTPGYVNPPGAILFPFRKGDELADKAKADGKDREWSRGKSVIVARSKFRPGLAVLLNGKVVDVNKEDEQAVKAVAQYFYHGVHGHVQLNFNAYDAVGNNPPGVQAFVNHVLSLNAGERLKGGGGGRSTTEVFGGYVGLTSDEDPTAGQRQELADIL